MALTNEAVQAAEQRALLDTKLYTNASDARDEMRSRDEMRDLKKKVELKMRYDRVPAGVRLRSKLLL